MVPDFKSLLSLGFPGMILAIFIVWVLYKNKGAEAYKTAAESLKMVSEAKEAELKEERGKKDSLRQELDQAKVEISELKMKVQQLEQRPDYTQVAQALIDSSKQDDARSVNTLKSVLNQFKAADTRARKYHEAQLKVLLEISEKIK